MTSIDSFVTHIHQTIPQRAPDWVLKLVVTRGTGGRGYMPSPEMIPTVLLSQNPMPCYQQSYSTEGVVVDFSEVILPSDPYLAGIKHLNRLPQVLASVALQPHVGCHADCQELLLCDAKGYVIEGTKTNIFIVNNNQILTPDLSNGGVCGVMRQWIIKQLLKHNIKVVAANLKKEDLISAQEIFLCNSIIKLWPVKGLGNHSKKVGKISMMLQQCIQKDLYAKT